MRIGSYTPSRKRQIVRVIGYCGIVGLQTGPASYRPKCQGEVCAAAPPVLRAQKVGEYSGISETTSCSVCLVCKSAESA
jgi:hypothetical protein